MKFQRLQFLTPTEMESLCGPAQDVTEEKTGELFTPRGWPWELQFTGRRAEGKETVAFAGHRFHVYFGWFAHFHQTLPQDRAHIALALSWQRRLREWARPQGVPVQLRIAKEAPWEHIHRDRDLVLPKGYRREELEKVLSGRSQELLTYLHRVLPVEVTWRAKDPEAAAWCELLHARERGFPGASCALCGLAFIRPRTYPVKLCPTCRSLTWRQQARIRAMPKHERVYRALDAALTALKASPAWRLLPFQGGPEGKKGE